jgi:hypothetical protein
VGSGVKGLALNVAAGLATAGASVHMGDFYDQKGKVPLINTYNEALESSKVVRGQLALIGLLWCTSSFVQLLGAL